jgi:hypothetical protein
MALRASKSQIDIRNAIGILYHFHKGQHAHSAVLKSSSTIKRNMVDFLDARKDLIHSSTITMGMIDELVSLYLSIPAEALLQASKPSRSSRKSYLEIHTKKEI